MPQQRRDACRRGSSARRTCSFEYRALDARLRWYGPEVVLRDVRVLDRRRLAGAVRDARRQRRARPLEPVPHRASSWRAASASSGRSVTVVRLAGRPHPPARPARAAGGPSAVRPRPPAGRARRDRRCDGRLSRPEDGPRAARAARDLDVQLRRDRDVVVIEGNARAARRRSARTSSSTAAAAGSLDAARAPRRAASSSTRTRLRLAGLADFLPPQVARPLAGSGRLRGVAGARARRRCRTLRLDVATCATWRCRLPRACACRRSRPCASALRGRTRAPAARCSSPTVTKAIVERRAAAAAAHWPRYGGLAGDAAPASQKASLGRSAIEELRAQSRARGARRAIRSDCGTLARQAGDALRARAERRRRSTWPRLWPLVLAFAPAGVRSLGRTRRRAGECETLRASVQRERAGIRADVHGAARSSSASASSRIGRFPGLSGVTARLDGTDQRGHAAAARGPTRVRVAAHVPRADRARARRRPDVRLAPRRRARGFSSAKRRTVLHRQGRAQVDVELRLREPRRLADPGADAEVRRGRRARSCRKSLPVGRLRERTIAWLDRAFVRRHGHERPLASTADRCASFRSATARVISPRPRDVDRRHARLLSRVRAARRWPRAPSSSTTRRSKRDVARGNVGGLRLSQAAVPHRRLQGGRARDRRRRLAGDLRQALDVRAGEPARADLGKQFMGLTGSGPRSTRSSSSLPCRGRSAGGDADDRHRPRDYTVRAMLDGVTVALPALRAPAQHVTGTFELHNYEVQRAGAARHDPRRAVRTCARAPGRTSPRRRCRGAAHGHGSRGRRAAARLHRPADDHRDERRDGLGRCRATRATTSRRRLAAAVRRRERPRRTRDRGAAAVRQGARRDAADARAARDSRRRRATT